jgi:phytoene synthase
MMARIMGVHPDDGETLDRACDLGLAFQLANIARDIVEDDAAGRCYLPKTWLDEMGWEQGEHALPENRFRLAWLMPRLIALMEKHEAAARLGTKRLRFRQRWAVLSAARIYGAIGRKVLTRGQLAWDSRTRVGSIEKLWHMIAAFFEALWNRPKGPREPIVWSRHDFKPVAGW